MFKKLLLAFCIIYTLINIFSNKKEIVTKYVVVKEEVKTPEVEIQKINERIERGNQAVSNYFNYLTERSRRDEQWNHEERVEEIKSKGNNLRVEVK